MAKQLVSPNSMAVDYSLAVEHVNGEIALVTHASPMPFVTDHDRLARGLELDYFSNKPKPIPDTVSVISRQPNGLSTTEFELTTTKGIHDAIRGIGFRSVRRAFTELTDQILQDPFGATSIDEFVDTDAGQWARVVHAVEDEVISSLVSPVPLALKGTGMNMQSARDYLERGGAHRSNLIDQFKRTLEVARAQKASHPDGINGVVDVVPVYGVVRYPDGEQYREWMLMERVVGGNSVNQRMLNKVIIGGGTRPEAAFAANDYPELARVVNEHDEFLRSKDRDYVDFDDLAEALAVQVYGPSGKYMNPFKDLQGHNILEVSKPDGSKNYHIIDVGGIK